MTITASEITPGQTDWKTRVFIRPGLDLHVDLAQALPYREGFCVSGASEGCKRRLGHTSTTRTESVP